jgi:HAD superfamily hydrolase (TIGR01509 family)
MITTLVFDWGDTIMVDFALPGPMERWEKVAWIPGVEETLPGLHERYTTCIATSAAHSGTEEMVRALKRVGAEKYFHHFFSSNDLGFMKPDPRFFSSILEKMKIRPEESVMIGNLYDKDITGAKQCGMHTVLLDASIRRADVPLADFVMRHFTELPEILRSL